MSDGGEAIQVEAPSDVSSEALPIAAAAPADPDFAPAFERLLNPPRIQQSNKLFLISIVVFAGTWMLRGDSSPMNLAILVGVLFFHELGHAAAMLVCGYRDVRVFFVPLLGAATQGRARGVARWKQALVLLAGPLPGIIAGAVLVHQHVGSARMLIMMLLGINAFNLLPLEPLDGGRLFQVLLFSRNRYLELVFRALTVGLLALLALKWELWILAAFSVFILLQLGGRKRTLDAAQSLKNTGLPADPHALTGEQRQTLYAAARATMPVKLAPQHNAAFLALRMDQLLEVATTMPARLGETMGMLVLWAGSIGLVVLSAIQLRSSPVDFTAQWQRYDRAGFSIELPHPPRDRNSPTGPIFGTATTHGDYGVATALEAGGRPIDAQQWADQCRDSATSKATVIHDDVAPREHRLDVRDTDGRMFSLRCVGTDHAGYMVWAKPGNTDDARRVLDSFRAQ